MKYISIILMFSLVSCSDMDATDCEFADWKKIGEETGAKGLSSDDFRDKFNECNEYGIKADRDTYLTGWNQGIKSFCTAKNGFDYGKEHEYDNTCPKDIEPEFLKGYKYGSELREQRQYLGRLESELSKKNRRIDNYEKSLRRGEDPKVSKEDYNESKDSAREYRELINKESDKYKMLKQKYNDMFKI